jgi:protease I
VAAASSSQQPVTHEPSFVQRIRVLSMSEVVIVKVLIPLPHYGFDPTEAAIPFISMKEYNNINITFTTPDGKIAECDQILIHGKGLGIFAPMLRADTTAVEAYNQMVQSTEFKHPVAWSDIQIDEYDILLLPGGHAAESRQYLDSSLVQGWASKFFYDNKIVAAICHGTLIPGRAKQLAGENKGKSLLWGRTTTGLTRGQELYGLYMTYLTLGRYYQTYPEFNTLSYTFTMCDELKSYLKNPENDYFCGNYNFFARIPTFRDSKYDTSKSFIHVDGNYLSARWPGDVNKFSQKLVEMIQTYSKNKVATISTKDN